MKITTSVQIDRPIDEVWAFFDAPSNMHKWLKNFKEFIPLSGEQGKVGAKAKHIYQEGKREVEMIEEILEKSPPHRFVGKFTTSGMEAIIVNELEAMSNGSTNLVGSSDFTFTSFFYKLFSPFFKGKIKERQDGGLLRLKAVLEEGNPG